MKCKNTTINSTTEVKYLGVKIDETLSDNLEACNDWLIDNRLSLHLGKTEAMIRGTKCKIKNKEGFRVKCKNTTINSTTEVKYLSQNR